MSVGEALVSVDEVLPRRPVAVRRARALASDALGATGPEPHDGLALVITELVANAVRHGRGRRMRLRLVTYDGGVRVEVENRCWHTMPRRRLLTESQPDGRGLALVAACSRSWGIEHAARGRTRVWAEVVRP
ncbi:MAG TPA: ATP-binding protein [Miltoncostaeaceae bacterium]|nr:ATP-binding protein [Miltoncostaeaceae bacterium]